MSIEPYAGITLYRPLVNSSVQYNKDQDGNNISAVNTDVYVDYVYPSDVTGSSLYTHYNDIVMASMSSDGNKKIKGISLSNDSHFLDKLILTITIETPGSISYINNSLIPSGVRVRSISESSEVKYPHDISYISTPFEDSYKLWCNKAIEYNYSVQVSCDGGIGDEDKVVSGLQAALPPASVLQQGEDYGFVTTVSASKSASNNGTSFSIRKFLYPIKASGALLADWSTNTSYDPIRENGNRSYKLTLTNPVGPVLTDDESSNEILRVNDKASDRPFDEIDIIYNWYKARPGSGLPFSAAPGGTSLISKPCIQTQPAPITGSISCYWRNKSVSIEKNYSNNSCSLTVEQSSDEANCDISGYLITSSVTKKYANVVAEAFAWAGSGAIVQKMNTSKVPVFDYTITVKNLLSNSPQPVLSSPLGGGNPIDSLIRNTYNNMSYIKKPGATGYITNDTLTIKDDEWTLNITEYSGEAQWSNF